MHLDLLSLLLTPQTKASLARHVLTYIGGSHFNRSPNSDFDRATPGKVYDNKVSLALLLQSSQDLVCNNYFATITPVSPFF
ncbi:hypothetical protein F4820DRAFT_412769 [Hypoxylon rubiginosum]|uniref:Uncharacterized protein n=1 Tax=Hypoxylon rubiginosum TaxID=110542 RepID=A0ACB9Z7I8_9PEZI|nr:hypothetical protein F4820DRAFT_412769 [Hypoxylon rubiginosum]